jgi:probable O-glycosylation ligase (exosortase A-associated)
MLLLKSRRRGGAVLAVVATALLLLAIVPDDWLMRMNTIGNYEGDASAEGRLTAWAWAWNMALAHPILGGGFRVFVLDAYIFGGTQYREAHNIFFEIMAEHGFVGLGLFCLLLTAAYRSCGVVLRQAGGRDDLSWAADLARTVQIALVAYAVGGMFVSIATSPLIYDLVAIAVGLRTVVGRAAVSQGAVHSSSPMYLSKVKPSRVEAGSVPI